MSDAVNVTGVHLDCFGNRAAVRLEIDGQWVEVIHTFQENSGHVSHIVELAGIRRAIERMAERSK